MENLDLKYKRFQEIISGWTKAHEGLCKMAEDIAVREDVDQLRNQVDTLMLGLIRKLFEVNKDDHRLLDDEWFWAEWDSTKECFYYVYGKTSNERLERQYGSDSIIDWPKDAFLCVLKGKSTIEARMIAKEDAQDYFNSIDLAFTYAEQQEIHALESGQDYDDTDMIIYKG